MNPLRKKARIFEEMGLGPQWRLRSRIKEAAAVIDDQPETTAITDTPAFSVLPSLVESIALKTTITLGQDFSSWEELESTISHCQRCGLCKTRTNTVVGIGDIHADWLFIGEGPGYFEDQQGEPFVGRSGALLDNMMAALGIKRGKNAYIANIVKCRASDERKKDRPPTEEEAAMCLPYLHWQIKQIQPKIMIALGRTAATSLLNTGSDVTMASLRGKVYSFTVDDKTIPLIVTYHPAYLLRTLMAKKQAWEDLCLAMDTLEGA